MPDLPIESYLARIGYTGPTDPVAATLTALHRHHAYAIPFENLDPFAGRPVSLEAADLVEKLIDRRRGGYCFEQNGLFQLVLQTLGYQTRSLAARVLISEGNYGPRTHQITLVQFEGATAWLADVGFGGNGLVEPIPFRLGCEYQQPLERFRIQEDAIYGYQLQHLLPAGWRTLYAFSLDPFLPSDFRALNYFICRSPDSIFTQLPICVRTTPTDRRIIVADKYKVRSAGRTETFPISDGVTLREILSSDLDLHLPADFPLPDPQPAPPGTREI